MTETWHSVKSYSESVGPMSQRIWKTNEKCFGEFEFSYTL